MVFHVDPEQYFIHDVRDPGHRSRHDQSSGDVQGTNWLVRIMDWNEKRQKMIQALDLIEEVRKDVNTRTEKMMLDGSSLSTNAIIQFYTIQLKDKG
jgi:hypothetical protein